MRLSIREAFVVFAGIPKDKEITTPAGSKTVAGAKSSLAQPLKQEYNIYSDTVVRKDQIV